MSAIQPTKLLNAGSTALPNAARITYQDCTKRSLWSVMAAAISSALPIPLTLPRVLIDSPRPLISPINNLTVDTASLEPKALAKASLSATSKVSPYLPLILVRISIIGSNRPWESVNSSPNAFCALPTPAKNALYLVPDSLPDMVDCSVPKMAICSLMAMPALVASAPIAVNAPDISEPVVLNACTAVAVMPVTCATHSLFPMSLAWFLKMPYMVPM